MKKYKVMIDADYLIFQVTEGKDVKSAGFKPIKSSKSLVNTDYKEPLKPYKKALKEKVNMLMDEIAANVVGTGIKIKGKPRLVFSDPVTNFRYRLFPKYKDRDKGSRSKLFYRLRKWAVKEYEMYEDFEADDIVSWYAAQGKHLIVSFDKDVYNSTGGVFYNPHHMHKCIIKTSKEDAERFVLFQTVMGDLTDNIEGIKGVGKVTATKLLDKFGWNWNGVVKSYESKGFTREDAILTRRLVGMDQVERTKSGKFKLRLFDEQHTKNT